MRSALTRNVKNWKDTEREEMNDQLCTFDDDIDWNPLNFYPAGHDDPENISLHFSHFGCIHFSNSKHSFIFLLVFNISNAFNCALGPIVLYIRF